MSNPAYAYIQLGERDELLGIRKLIADALSDAGAEWQPTETFHITLAYAEDMDDTALESAFVDGVAPFSVRVSGLSLFNNPESRALVLVVDHSAELDAIQQQVYEHMAQPNVPMSAHSEPSGWQPHVTIAYLPDGVDMPQVQFSPFTLGVDEINYSRDDYQVVRTVMANETTTPVIRAYFAGGSIKALKDGEFGGILVPFGGPRDAHGEFFYPDVELREERYGRLPVLFHHGLTDFKDEEVGVIESLQRTAEGLYAKARLFLDHADARIRALAYKLWEDIQSGKLGWSSGSADHLVEIDANGGIKRWPVIEATVTYSPAGKERTTLAALKTANAEAVPVLPELFDTSAIPSEPASEEPAAKETTQAAWAALKTILTHRKLSIHLPLKGSAIMPDITKLIAVLQDKGVDAETALGIVQELGGAEAPDEPVMADEPTPEEEEEEIPVRTDAPEIPNGSAKTYNAAEVRQIVAAVRQSMKTAPAPAPVLPATTGKKPGSQGGSSIQVKSKYSALDFDDLAFFYTVMNAAARKSGQANWQPSEPKQFYNELAIKAEKTGRNFEDNVVGAIKAIKSDELNYSTQASFGDEFVPEMWRSQLWETPRLENVVFANTDFIPMPSNPYKVPIQGSDPTVYAVGETKNEAALTLADTNSPIPDSKVGTSNGTMTAAKLALRVMVSEELNEDSIIPVATLWREQAVRAMEDARDNVLLNADATTGTSNINNDGGSISAGTKVLYGGGDGFLHLPLVDNTALAVNMGGVAPTLTKIREARAKLGRALMADYGRLVYYCDPLTWMKLLSLDEPLVQSINGRGSTFNDGQIPAIDGIPVKVSNEMALASSTGVVSSTAGNNTLGRLLLVHRGSWLGGFRREISVNFDYLPWYDAWVLVVSMRMALLRRSTDSASLLYNIAI